MNEMLYSVDTAFIALALFVSIGAAIEAGYRIGCRSSRASGDDSKTHVNAIQASMIGILALLLGFTFSLSLQRFDMRSDAVVDEANAIGTAYLRADLLPAEVRGEVRTMLRDYLNLRVAMKSVALDRVANRKALHARVGAMQTALWAQARRAAELDANPVRTGLYIDSLNELIDSYGRRHAGLDRHVPEVVLLLLYITFLMAGSIMGYAAGLGGHRPSLATYMMVTLMITLVFLILDLDRPRRGLITVSGQSLIDLKRNIDVPPTAAPKPPLSP